VSLNMSVIFMSVRFFILIAQFRVAVANKLSSVHMNMS
jgi:hypothetical protein